MQAENEVGIQNDGTNHFLAKTWDIGATTAATGIGLDNDSHDNRINDNHRVLLFLPVFTKNSSLFFIQNDDMNYFLANTWESFVATQHPLALGETMMAMTAK